MLVALQVIPLLAPLNCLLIPTLLGELEVALQEQLKLILQVELATQEVIQVETQETQDQMEVTLILFQVILQVEQIVYFNLI
jgi:hypothetical protein